MSSERLQSLTTIADDDTSPDCDYMPKINSSCPITREPTADADAMDVDDNPHKILTCAKSRARNNPIADRLKDGITNGSHGVTYVRVPVLSVDIRANLSSMLFYSVLDVKSSHTAD